MSQVSLDRARGLSQREDGLAVVAVTRDDGSVHTTVIKAGLLDHPVTGDVVVGFVAPRTDEGAQDLEGASTCQSGRCVRFAT